MRIEWTEKFRAGVEKLDAQHKELIEMVNELQRQITMGSSKEELGKVVNKIYEHKKAHFADEERLMLDHNYPKFEQHAKEHKDMLDRLSEFIEGVAAGDKIVSVELTGFLAEWLLDHIAQTDTLYGPFLNDRGVY